MFGANAEGELFVDVFARKRPSPASLIFTEASLIRIPFESCLGSFRLLRTGSKRFGNPLAMGGEKLIDEGADLIEIEFSGGVRVQHGRVIDEAMIALEDRFDRQGLHVNVGDGMRPIRTG